MNELVLDQNERIVYALRNIYETYGYIPYRMSKFEEYKLYANHMNFLVSDRVITFTDTTGKLMALKPDVTLSLVKNVSDEPDKVQKLYYNENVYRVSKGSNSFKEIMQTGLECIGSVDRYCISEVLNLAMKSLEYLSDHYLLEVSSLDLLNRFIDQLEPAKEIRREILKLTAEKNMHGIRELCTKAELNSDKVDALLELLNEYGRYDQIKDKLHFLCEKYGFISEFNQFEEVLKAFGGTEYAAHMIVEFSVVSDVNYYNGIVFNGFIEGIPNVVLAGGQYDQLMKKMKHKSKAIGFAVYLDQLEPLMGLPRIYDTDIVLLYDESSDLNGLVKAVDRLSSEGKSVKVVRTLKNENYRILAEYKNGEVNVLENNA